VQAFVDQRQTNKRRGYSLPDDDVEVVYLVKRGLAHLTADRVTVVEYDMTMPPLASHTVGRRYRTLFGDGVDWHPEGLDNWLGQVQIGGRV
jgi:hypothetical protein